MVDDTLYEQDFFAWTQAQAKALRARRSGANDLDYDNLAEEVADLGKSELNACRSAVRQILAHLLKIEYARRTDPINHWKTEVMEFRLSLEDRLTPTLRRRIPRELDKLYDRARDVAAAGLVDDDPKHAAGLPENCPYSWDQITATSPHWWPNRR